MPPSGKFAVWGCSKSQFVAFHALCIFKVYHWAIDSKNAIHQWHLWRRIMNIMMKLQDCRGSLTSLIYLPCTPLLDLKKKHPIPSAPAAKSLEGSEECKLAYHQKLLSKNDVSMLCIMSSKMGRFSNDITVYTYIYIYIYMVMSHGI